MTLFRFYWLSGKTEDASGHTASDALRTLGYGPGALAALDYFAPLEETPSDAPVLIPFRFFWLSGKTEDGAGVSVQDAFQRLGYNSAATAALDYYTDLSAVAPDVVEEPLTP